MPRRHCCRCCEKRAFPYECLTMDEFLSKNIIVEYPDDWPPGQSRPLYVQNGKYVYKCAVEIGSVCYFIWLLAENEFVDLTGCNYAIVFTLEDGIIDGRFVLFLETPCSFTGFNSSTAIEAPTRIWDEEEFFCDGTTIQVGYAADDSNAMDVTLVDGDDTEAPDCTPPPELTDCTGLSGCEDMPDALVRQSGMGVYDDPPAAYDADTYYIRHWDLSGLNGELQMPYVSDTYKFEMFLNEGGEAAIGDYGDPGVKVAWDEYKLYADDSVVTTLFNELWAYKSGVTISCSDGKTTVAISWQGIQEFASTNYPAVPPSITVAGEYTPGYFSSTSPHVIVTGGVFTCASSAAMSQFLYGVFNFNGTDTESRSFNVIAQIGDSLSF